MSETLRDLVVSLSLNSDNSVSYTHLDVYKRQAGLAEDVRYYGEWMKQEAFKRIGHLYPKAKLADGSEAKMCIRDRSRDGSVGSNPTASAIKGR